MNRYRIEYDNDTGPGDDDFCEWWEVYDGDRAIAHAYTEEDAVKIRDALNCYAPSQTEGRGS